MKTMTMNFRFASVAALGFLCAFTGAAAPIFVTNFSFEALPVGGLTNAGCGTGCLFSTGAIPGWTGVSVASGQFQPGTQLGNLAYFSTLSDGITVGYSQGATLSQTVLPTVQVGVTYTLSVDLGQRNDMPFRATADLLINGLRTPAVGIVPTPGHWSTYTASYTGLVADINRPITIELSSLGTQADFDNVRLADSTQATPEPAGVTFVGLGLVGLSLLTRRKRTS